MKAFYLRLSLLFSISLLSLFSCHVCKKKAEPKAAETIEQPRPLSEHQTDSLKNYLDEERARRKNQGKE